MFATPKIFVFFLVGTTFADIIPGALENGMREYLNGRELRLERATITPRNVVVKSTIIK
jgi:hypothetical protein